MQAIFRAKGRPQDNPVILHVASAADALPLWAHVDEVSARRAHTLANAFWPGPLTLVARRSNAVPDVVTAGLARVAVRVPAHDVFVNVLRALGEPLAAPSANASSRPSPTSAADVLASLDGVIDAVVDGGPCKYGIESTVVDVASARVLRLGATSLSELQAFLPELRAWAASGDTGTVEDANAAAASPGLRHTHYAPRGKRVTLVDDGSAALHDAWSRADVAVLVRASTAARLGAREAALEVLPDDAAGYGRGLYAALYRLERCAAPSLVCVDVPGDDAWAAVRDRIARAAGNA